MATTIIGSITGIFHRISPKDAPKPTEEELNVIRVFALGNRAMRQAAMRINDKYQHCDDILELEFIREIESPHADSALCTMYRDTIRKNCKK